MIWIEKHIELLIEIIAVILGVFYVVLAAKNNKWCWVFGIFSSAISIVLFVLFAKLYAEAFLYFFYVIAGIYGWIIWNNNTNQHQVYQHTLKKHLFIIIIGTLLSIGLYLIISFFFADAQKPLIDAFTTAFSFIATYLTAKKWIENWLYWIIIDLITIYLYFSRGLEIYALLMLLYAIIAAYGYLKWKKLSIIKMG